MSNERVRVITEEQYKEYMKLKHHFGDTDKKVRGWKPKDYDKYYAISWKGRIDCYMWNSDSEDDSCFKLGNCFKTEEEAQKELDRRFAEQEIFDFCDWVCGLPRYEIDFDSNSGMFTVFGDLGGLISSPYRFASEESCKLAIDTLGTEKLKLIFRID